MDNAEEVRDFYSKVVGWKHSDHQMEGYCDYNIMSPVDEKTVTGICHRRGFNEKMPAQWLNYVSVENLDDSIKSCESHGGKVIDGPKKMGNSRFAVIQDPAGAYLGLMEE